MRRFAGLKKDARPADGVWVAWPKKASQLETDLDFAAVQRIGLDAGLVDNKSIAVDESWQAVRLRLPRVSDRPRARASSARRRAWIRSGSTPRASARSSVRSWKRTMSDDGMRRSGRASRRSRARAARRRPRARARRPSPRPPARSSARLVDRGEVAVRAAPCGAPRRHECALAQLQHRLLSGRPSPDRSRRRASARARSRGSRSPSAAATASGSHATSSPRSAASPATAHV